mmetsp:Transcript_108825/g.307825  ORF Transcript_108825/g.307825 Transcript_108825/m.307825 type:complete len:716 (-) Transcript_108825:340-2487(-)
MSSSPVSLSTTMATSSQPVIHLMPGPPRTLRRFSPHWTTSIMLGLPRPPVALIPWNFSQPHSRLQRATFVRSSQKPPTTKELLYLPYGSAKRVGSGGGFFAAASLAAASLAAASLFAAACLAAAAAAASAWGFPAGCDGPGGGALAASSFFRSASAASSGTPALRSACTISCFSLQPRMLTSKFFARSFSLATGSSSSFGAGGASGGVPSVVEWRLHLFLTTGTTSMGLRSCVFSNFVLWLSSSHTAQRNASQLRHWTTARSAGTFSQPSHLLRFGFGAGFGAGAAGFTVGGISFFAILDGCEVPTSAGRFTPAVLGGLLPLAAGFGALAPVLLSPAAPLLPPLVPVEGAAVPPAGFPLASSLVARPHRWRQRAVWTKRRSTGPTGLSGAASFLAESPSFFSASPSFFSASPSFFSPSPSFLSASFFCLLGLLLERLQRLLRQLHDDLLLDGLPHREASVVEGLRELLAPVILGAPEAHLICELHQLLCLEGASLVVGQLEHLHHRGGRRLLAGQDLRELAVREEAAGVRLVVQERHDHCLGDARSRRATTLAANCSELFLPVFLVAIEAHVARHDQHLLLLEVFVLILVPEGEDLLLECFPVDRLIFVVLLDVGHLLVLGLLDGIYELLVGQEATAVRFVVQELHEGGLGHPVRGGAALLRAELLVHFGPLLLVAIEARAGRQLQQLVGLQRAVSVLVPQREHPLLQVAAAEGF